MKALDFQFNLDFVTLV